MKQSNDFYDYIETDIWCGSVQKANLGNDETQSNK